MNKKQFDNELVKAMDTNKIPHKEQRRVLEYYNEIYNEKRELLIPEEAIILGFGSPYKIANDMASETTVAGKMGNRTRQKLNDTRSWVAKLFTNKSFLIFYFSAFFITIPLTIAVLATAFGLTVAIIGVTFSIFITFLALFLAGFIGGTATIGIGIYNILIGHTNTGLALIGMGFGLIAIGILILFIARILRHLRVFLFVKSSRKDAAYDRLSRGKGIRIVGCILFVSFIAGGSGLFALGMHNVDWDIKQLDTMTYVNKDIPLDNDITQIINNTKHRTVKIIETDNNFRVEAHNYNYSELEISYENGILTINENYDRKAMIKNEILNQLDFNWKKQEIRIYVPHNFVSL